MKVINFFKKNKASASATKPEKLEDKQLEQIVGGLEETTIVAASTDTKSATGSRAVLSGHSGGWS